MHCGKYGIFVINLKALLSIDNGDFDLLKIISVAVREMSEGELPQRDDLILLKIFITKLSEKKLQHLSLLVVR
jgi:hypothetical protein